MQTCLRRCVAVYGENTENSTNRKKNEWFSEYLTLLRVHRAGG
jgi:hypothetical protein